MRGSGCGKKVEKSSLIAENYTKGLYSAKNTFISEI